MDLATYKATVGVTGGSTDAQLQASLDTASRAIELACGMRFFAAADPEAEPTVRYYTPIRPMTLDIDDAIDVVELATDITGEGNYDQVWVLNRDFYLKPENAPVNPDGTPGYPYTQIRVHPWTHYVLPPLPRAGRVTAHYGWPALHPNVVEYCGILTAKLVKRKKEAPFGIQTFGTEGAMRIAQKDPMWNELMCDLVRDQVIGP